MLRWVHPAVVTTIALEEDAPLSGTDSGGDDDCVGGGCSAGFARGGDDDYFGGSDTLVSRPIAREQASACDYRQWRKKPACWLLTIGGVVWRGATLPSSGARKRKLSRPPLQGRDGRTDDDAAITDQELAPGLPTRGAQLCKGGRTRLPVPVPPNGRYRASGNRSPTTAAKRLAPRTISGGRPATQA